jgi:lipopolysaccharide export system protein LptA
MIQNVAQKIKSQFNRQAIALLSVAFLCTLLPLQLLGQSQKTKIELEQADVLKSNDKIYGKGVQAVFGNVRFRHSNTLLFCDSAYMFRDSNKVTAYSNVHMIHNDSLHLYGKTLHYFGNENMAKVRENVRMVKDSVTLFTEFLDYDRVKNVGYYFNGGKVVSNENTLTSEWGYFYPNQNEVFFKDSVNVHNPKYTMFSDTMKYHTVSEIVSILGPTFIVSDSNLVYSEDGYYNTKTDYAQLLKNSYIQGKTETLWGDTINYDRPKGMGEVFGNMVLVDTVNQVIIKGNYGRYNEITKSALSTKKALLQQIYRGDTLHLHADTLRMDSIPELGTKLIRAYYKVRFFRSDIQGRCDSMVYNLIDSTNTMYYDPVVWAQESQMTAQTIKFFSRNEEINRVELNNAAFVAQQEDSLLFNQIKGKNMVGYFRLNELYKIDVDGNGQTIYYPKDQANVIGVNRAESSNMTLFFVQRQIERIIMRVTPGGNMNPPYILPDKDVKLSGFIWLEDFRPKNKDDIFKTMELPKMEDRPIYDDFQDAGMGK